MRVPVLLCTVVLLAGCLGGRQGLDLTVQNETDAPVDATFTLKRGTGETLATRNVTLAPREIAKVNDIIRMDGRYLLNLTLADGRSTEAEIISGGAYGTPQVKIGSHELLIFQEADIPPRSL